MLYAPMSNLFEWWSGMLSEWDPGPVVQTLIGNNALIHHCVRYGLRGEAPPLAMLAMNHKQLISDLYGLRTQTLGSHF